MRRLIDNARLGALSKVNSMKTISAFALTCAICLVSDATRGQDSSPAATKTAIFAGGCFWCIQPAFDKSSGRDQNDRRLLRRDGTEPDLRIGLLRKDRTTVSRSRSPTIRQKFRTPSCSTFIGSRSIRPRPTANLPTSVQAIGQPFFTATKRRRKLLKPQKRDWRAPGSSRNRSLPRFCRR